MTQEKKDFGCGVALVIFSIAALVYSSEIKNITTSTYDISSATFPRICATIILILGLILIAANIRKIKKTAVAASKESKEPTEKKTTRFLYFLAAIVGMILFVVLLKKVGFIICGTLYVFELMFILAPESHRTKKDYILFAVISVISTALIDALFVRGFHLMLPSGLIGF